MMIIKYYINNLIYFDYYKIDHFNNNINNCYYIILFKYVEFDLIKKFKLLLLMKYFKI